MLRSMYSATSGLNAFQTQLDVVGNNIANVDTTGFKAGRVEFSDILSQTLAGASAPQTPPGLGGVNPTQVGLGVNVAGVSTLFTQGADQQTGVPTDVALDGNGLFMVSPNAGAASQQIYYTRAGSFQVDASGNIVMPNGMKLLGYNNTQPNPPTAAGLAPVNISVIDPTTGASVPGQFTIGTNGTVTVTNPYTNATTTWNVPLATFMNPGGLTKAGSNTYLQSTNSGAAQLGYAGQQGFATFRPGALEASNVNLTTEFTNMIIAQQGFDSNSKVINTDNNILATIQTLEQQA